METPPSISVILPTKGRPTLERTIKSILPQMGERDEIYLIWDGKYDYQRRTPGYLMDERIDESWFPTPPDTPKPLCGQPQRNFALDNRVVSADLIMWCGDDDIYAEGSLDAVRACAAKHPGQVILCKLRGWWPGRGVIWQDQMSPEERFQEGWLGDHQIVSPNIPEKLGRFGLNYTGDWTYIKQTVENFGGLERVVWLDKLVAILRPEY